LAREYPAVPAAQPVGSATAVTSLVRWNRPLSSLQREDAAIGALKELDGITGAAAVL